MYQADDTVIYVSCNSISEIELQLSLELANVSHCLKENKLFLNLKKTECLLFGTRQRLKISGTADFSVTLDGTAAQVLHSFQVSGCYAR